MSERIGFEIDTSADTKALNDFIQALANLQKSGGTLAEALSGLAGASSEGEEAFDRMQQAAKEALTPMEEYARQVSGTMQPMVTTVDGASKSIGGLTKLIYDDTNALKEVSEPADKFDASLSAMDEYAARATESLAGVDKNAGEMGQTLEEAGNKGSGGVEKLLGRFLSVGVAIGTARKFAQEFGEAVKKAAEQGDADAQRLVDGADRVGAAWERIKVERAALAAKNGLADLAEVSAQIAEGGDLTEVNDQLEQLEMHNNPISGIGGLAGLIHDIGEAYDWLHEKITGVSDDVPAAIRPMDGLAKVASGVASEIVRSTDAMAQSQADLAEMTAANAGKITPYWQELDKERAAAEAANDPERKLWEALVLHGQAAEMSAEQHRELRDALEQERQAAEDARLAQLDGVLAISEYGREMDETFAEAKKEGVQLTADEMDRLVKGLFDAASEAEDLGKKVPLAQVDDLKTRAGNLKTTLDTMALTNAEREALLQYLDMVNEKLLAAESRARNAALGIGSMTPGGGAGMAPGGATAPGAGSNDVRMALGGTIEEPIRGLGMRTGRRYLLGESGVEDVVPRRNGQPAAGRTTNNYISIPGGRRGRREERDLLRRLVRELNWSR